MSTAEILKSIGMSAETVRRCAERFSGKDAAVPCSNAPVTRHKRAGRASVAAYNESATTRRYRRDTPYDGSFTVYQRGHV